MEIRKFNQQDIPPTLSLAKKLGMFDDAGLVMIKDTMELAIIPDNQGLWLVAVAEEQHKTLQGVVYACPEPMTNSVWNMLMLLVDPECQHRGIASQLVESLEQQLKTQKCRLLLVDTSGLPEYEKARKFYEKQGFKFQARIPDYYDVQDDKMTFSKYL